MTCIHCKSDLSSPPPLAKIGAGSRIIFQEKMTQPIQTRTHTCDRIFAAQEPRNTMYVEAATREAPQSFAQCPVRFIPEQSLSSGALKIIHLTDKRVLTSSRPAHNKPYRIPKTKGSPQNVTVLLPEAGSYQRGHARGVRTTSSWSICG